MSQDARKDNLSGLLEAFQNKLEIELEKKLPCIVEAVSADRKRVTVKPLIAIVGADGATMPRASIDNITVFQLGAGGLVISVPVNVGDLGWIEACDRDISLFLQSYGQSDPATFRRHSFSDGVFYPDVMKGFSIDAEDAGAIVIQTLDGSVKVAVDKSEVRIRNGAVEFTVSDSEIKGVAPMINLNGATIDATGSITSPVSVTAPMVTAGIGMTIAGVPVADSLHTHNAGGLLDSLAKPVSGITAGSNG